MAKEKKREQSIDQKIADYQARLKRLKQRREQQETGRKIITGALAIEAAKREPETRQWLRDLFEQHLTRVKDRERIQPLYDELREMDGLKPVSLKADENEGLVIERIRPLTAGGLGPTPLKPNRAKGKSDNLEPVNRPPEDTADPMTAYNDP